MMTSWERDNWYWCIRMLMCLHICLGCVTVNDDTAFPKPDTLWTKHSPRPAAIHQLVSSSRHRSSAFTVSVLLPLFHTYAHTHTHIIHEGAEEVPSGWHIAWALGRLQVCVKDEATNCLCIVFISSSHSCVFVHILTGNRRKCWCQWMAYFRSEWSIKAWQALGTHYSFSMLF